MGVTDAGTPPFCPPSYHSDYSLLDGASKIELIVETALSMGMKAVALTDHGNLFGALQFYNTARKKGIKPIIGCEVYVAKESRHKKTGGGDQSNHLVLLAENLEGYRNLTRLVSYGYLEGFYYKPRIDKELLRLYHGGLIAASACLKGAVAEKLAMEQFEARRTEALELRDIFGAGNFYLELQDHGLGAAADQPRHHRLGAKDRDPDLHQRHHYIQKEDSVATMCSSASAPARS